MDPRGRSVGPAELALRRWQNWALAARRAGLTYEALARRFPKLEAWEHGEAKPTLKQLEGFARVTHTPVGFLFLATPPQEQIPIPDFRSVASSAAVRPSPDLLDVIYACQQRQDWYREFASAFDEPPVEGVSSASLGDDIVETAERLRQALRFDVAQRKRLPTWTEALRRFIAQADALGVLVMVSGVVGTNNRRHLDPREFRGFALADRLAPLVFINGADTKAGQMFTLAHELAHIWLGQTGVSDAEARLEPEQATERWCNRVAAELLVPRAVLRAEYRGRAELGTELESLARLFKVSTLVVLRGIHDIGALTRPEFWALYDAELARLVSFQRRGGGGDFYLTLGARASKRFARAIVTSTLEGRTSFTEAFRLLGVRKMATFQRLGHNLGVGF